jgi:hypothetical protein
MKTTWRGKREELAGEERVTLLSSDISLSTHPYAGAK